MSRIPLEDIGLLTSVRMDTVKRGADYSFAQITLKDTATPVLSLPCVVAWEEFKAAVRAAQDGVLRAFYSTGAAAGPPVQPLVHQQPHAARPMAAAALTPSAPPARMMAPTSDTPPAYSSIAGGVSSDGAGAAATAADGAVVRTFVVSNSDASRVVPIKVFGSGPGAFVRYQADVRRRLDIPVDLDVRLYLPQGVEVTEVEDLVNDDRLLVCVGKEKPRLAILQKKA
jgi:hypothetical protein